MKEPAIVFKDFSFQYKVQHEPTLHDINLTIYKGEKVLILGSSGSGKSTLASCINGLIPFSHHGTMTGSVTVMGQETRESSIYGLSKTVGTVLQDSDAQFVGLSVAEDIAFAMENEAKPRREMVPIVEEHAATVGMSDFLGAVPFNLSGGQKQKVAIAGVLGSNVNILIFDEPLAALDPQMGNTAVELIDDLARDKERTINNRTQAGGRAAPQRGQNSADGGRAHSRGHDAGRAAQKRPAAKARHKGAALRYGDEIRRMRAGRHGEPGRHKHYSLYR